MVKCDGDSESDKIAASEAIVASHNVRHGQSFLHHVPDQKQ
jgi:hypothetical protein